MHRADRLAHQIVIGEGIAAADKGIAAHHAALEHRVLSHHGVLHKGGAVERGAEGNIAAVAHHAEHDLRAVHDVDVVADDAGHNHAARADGDVIPDNGRPMDDHARIDLAVAPDADHGGAGQRVLAFEDHTAEDVEFDLQRVRLFEQPAGPTQHAEKRVGQHHRDPT